MTGLTTWKHFWRDMQQLAALACVRNRSEADYRTFQAFQASLILTYMERHWLRCRGAMRHRSGQRDRRV